MTVVQQDESAFESALIDELSLSAQTLYSSSSHSVAEITRYKELIQRLCSQANLNQSAYLLDILLLLTEGLDRLVEENRSLTFCELSILTKLPSIINDCLIPSDSNRAARSLLDLLKNTQWIRPITHDEETAIFATFDSASDNTDIDGVVDLDDILHLSDSPDFQHGSPRDHTAEPSTPELESTTVDAASQDPGADLNTEQQELIDLIKTELAETASTQDELAQAHTSYDLDRYRHLLENMSVQAENIGNAIGLIGLDGLNQSAGYIARNLQVHLGSEDIFNCGFERLLTQWPDKILAYLKNISEADATNGLLALLSDPSWPEPLTGDEYETIKDLLDNPVFIVEEREQRQDMATEDDVSLALPDDVNQELLDGLLLDLPAQTEEFSTAIQSLSDGGGTEHLEIAQRIAHTLKGAANVVGVKGIANLTHHLEDILEAYSKSNTLPGEHLVSVLVRASDCLESMAEALLGIESDPEDAVTVLQGVLDWANKIDTHVPTNLETMGNSDTELKNPQASPLEDRNSDAESEKNNQQSRKNPAAEHQLRIPAALADNMLRLAGENLIFTSQIQEYVNILARKQEAIELHNQSLIQLSYDLEHLIDIHGFKPGSGITEKNGVFDPLEMDEYHEAHTISRRLVEIAADSVGLSQELDKDLSGLKELVVNQNQLHKESEELVLRTRMVPTATITPRLKRGVRQASRTTGKKVELEVRDNNTYMDSEVLNNLIDPLLHVLRNAIDHGIEDSDVRLSRGKLPVGKITLEFTRKGNQILIDVLDDGQGLDTDDIYAKALSRGLVQKDEDLSVENIQRLILEPGLTTREKVTHVSGRGIGLDVVNVKIRELKGSLDIFSVPEQGCKITLSIPISSFSTHSLLVRSRQFIHAVSSRGVEEILYPGIGDVRVLGNETIFQLGDETYNAVLLDKLLNLPPDRRKINRNVRPVLLVKDETGAKTAILVQEVIDSRDVVVKSMGSYMPKLKGVIGATVLGDGSVAPVIDLPELLLHAPALTDTPDSSPDTYKPQAQSVHVPNVLVVDDSLSARRSMSQFVQDMGFSVRTARDGMEAVRIMEKSKPDLLLVDMEMPKMNGLELTSHVRATPEINTLPVIMITSRSTDKHRKIALEKGVNHYMVKPFDEDELAIKISDMLETA